MKTAKKSKSKTTKAPRNHVLLMLAQRGRAGAGSHTAGEGKYSRREKYPIKINVDKSGD